MKTESALLKYAIGIDISKKDFKTCMVSINELQRVKVISSKKFPNSLSGFEAFSKWVAKNQKDQSLPITFIIEATGVYYEECAFFIQDQGFDIHVMLPTKSKHYLKYLGLKSKTDKIDAKGLATIAAQQSLKPWKPATKFYYKLRALTRQHQALNEAKTSSCNRMEAIVHSKYKDKDVQRSIQKEINLYKRELKIITAKIEEHITSNPEVSEKVEKIAQVKGLATLSISVIIAETFGFELFENYKQLISYAGYDVVENQSGKRSGKTKISKKGNSRIRRILFLPAFKVVTHKQTAFYNLFQRTLNRHGKKMKSYVAVQKKLLTTIYALWKKNEAYDNQYHNQINIQRLGEGVSLSGSTQVEETIAN